MNYTFGFIGAGNMGSALIKATAQNFAPDQICFYDKHADKCEKLLPLANCLSSAKEVVRNSEIIFIGVKPQAYQTTFDEIKEELYKNEKAVVVSMAAGVSINGVKKISGIDLPVIRIMPNTPCQIGSGVVLYSVGDGVSDSTHSLFLTAMEGAGFVSEIDEEKIDAGSVLSGCGPAFVFMFIEALKNGAVKCGLSEENALDYALKTVEGSAKLAYSSEDDLSTLIKKVCSPGGTTIEGVKSFQKDGLETIVENALKESYKRTLELKK